MRLMNQCVRFRFSSSVMSDVRCLAIDPAVWPHLVVVTNDVDRGPLEFTEG
jgi:hypothetical protein